MGKNPNVFGTQDNVPWKVFTLNIHITYVYTWHALSRKGTQSSVWERVSKPFFQLRPLVGQKCTPATELNSDTQKGRENNDGEWGKKDTGLIGTREMTEKAEMTG